MAGRRAGLAGERSGLWFEFARIIGEVQPRWVVIENVPGLLSSNGGRDFAVILRGLVELGYGVAWRVLDSQYAGVAQRRRRVFIVGCLGDGASAFKVLFEPESGIRDTPPSRKAGKVAATLPASGAGTSRTGNERTEADLLVTTPMFVPDVAKSLKAGGNDRHCESHETYIPVVQEVANTLTSRHDSSPDGLGSGFTVVPDVLPFDTTQVTSASNYSNPKPGDPCHPLAATAHPPAVAFTTRPAHPDKMPWRCRECGEVFVDKFAGSGPDGLSPPECPKCGEERNLEVAQTTAHGFQGEDVSHAIRANPSKADKPDSTTYVIEPKSNDAQALNPDQPQVWRVYDTDGIAPALQSGEARGNAILTAGVRRLTPRECERLQGFPDDFTKVDDKTPDSPRYRTMGNAVTVNVSYWLGERIMLVDQQREEKANV